MDTVIPTPPHETLPADVIMFANWHTRTKRAEFKISHIGWWRGPEGKDDEPVEYHCPKDMTCWKLVKPNPNLDKGRHSLFRHRGPSISPATPR